MENKDTLYTHYQIELVDINEDWDFTICESLDDVLETLKYLDVHLDDETNPCAKVIITGIGMTRSACQTWKSENLIKPQTNE